MLYDDNYTRRWLFLFGMLYIIYDLATGRIAWKQRPEHIFGYYPKDMRSYRRYMFGIYDTVAQSIPVSKSKGVIGITKA